MRSKIKWKPTPPELFLIMNENTSENTFFNPSMELSRLRDLRSQKQQEKEEARKARVKSRSHIYSAAHDRITEIAKEVHDYLIPTLKEIEAASSSKEFQESQETAKEENLLKEFKEDFYGRVRSVATQKRDASTKNGEVDFGLEIIRQVLFEVSTEDLVEVMDSHPPSSSLYIPPSRFEGVSGKAREKLVSSATALQAGISDLDSLTGLVSENGPELMEMNAAWKDPELARIATLFFGPGPLRPRTRMEADGTLGTQKSDAQKFVDVLARVIREHQPAIAKAHAEGKLNKERMQPPQGEAPAPAMKV